jgi:hypothetical protein
MASLAERRALSEQQRVAMSTDQRASAMPRARVEFGPWLDRPIKYMIYWTSDYVVYMDQDLKIDYEFSEGPADIAEFNRILNKSRILENAVSKEFDNEDVISCKFLIGEGIACAIEGDFENAKQMFAYAENSLQVRREELSRIWYVTDSGLAAVVIVILDCFLWALHSIIFSGPAGDMIFWLALGAGAGAFGSFISIVARSGNLELDPKSGRFLHRVEASLRILVGFTSGLVTALAIKAGLLLPKFGENGDVNLILLIAAFAAGGGERFVTSVISDANALGLKGGGVRTSARSQSGGGRIKSMPAEESRTAKFKEQSKRPPAKKPR